MTNGHERNENRPRPIGWPEGKPLPSVDEAEKTVRKIEEDIARRLEELDEKLPATDADFPRAQITI